MKVVACAIVTLGAVSLAQAQEKKAASVDPSGIYTWVQGGRGGGPGATNTLVLKLEGGKLTGSLTAPGRAGRRGGAADTNAAPPPPPAPVKTDISEGKVDGDTVSFKVVVTAGGNERITSYTGKVSGDTITGTVTPPGRGGAEPTARPWTATKQK